MQVNRDDTFIPADAAAEGKWANWNSDINNFKQHEHVKSKLICGTAADRPVDISVVIPTYKCGVSLFEAIQSAVQQKSNCNFEVLVVDNNCAINIEKVALMQSLAAEFHQFFYYQNEENLGALGNFNRCIELARGEWVCTLHDDDLLMPGFIEAVMNAIATIDDKSLAALGVMSAVADIRTEPCDKIEDKKGDILKNILQKLRGPRCIPIRAKDVLFSFGINPYSNVLNREKMLALGGYNEAYFPSGDLAFFAKLYCQYKAYIIPQVLTIRRIEANDTLKPEICIKSFCFSAYLAKYVARHLALARREAFYIGMSTVVAEQYLSQYNQLDYNKMRIEMGIHPKYNNRFIKRWLLIVHQVYVFIAALRK